MNISLIKLDFMLYNYPSSFINLVTAGSKGATMCARLYLYNRYISKNNIVVNGLLKLIDYMEKDHCYASARYWRARHKKKGVYFPARYSDFLMQNDINKKSTL